MWSNVVELRGFEPLTYSMRTSRNRPTCAFASSSCDGCARKPQLRALVVLAAGSCRKFCYSPSVPPLPPGPVASKHTSLCLLEPGKLGDLP